MSLFEERSTSGTSATSQSLTSQVSLSAISSPASADGPTPCDSPAGPTTVLCGRDLALASPSVLPEKAEPPPTNDICGPPSTVSSHTLALQSSLASRLHRRLDCNGSMLFKLIWKTQAMPSGLPICRLRASARRTSDKDSSGWPSPLVNDAKGSDYTYNQGRHDSISLKLGGTAKLASPWATPAARDYHSESATDTFNEKRWSHSRGKPLSAQATLSTWVSPQAADSNGSGMNQHTASLCKQTRTVTSWPTPTSSLADKGVRSFEGGIHEAMRSRGPDLAAVSCLASWATPVATELGNTLENYLAMKANMKSGPRSAITHPSLQAQLATWPTPAVANAVRGGQAQRMETGRSNLQDAVMMSNWPTPMAGTPAQNGYNEAGNTDSSRKTVGLVSGPTATGSPAGMENRGQLNPQHSRWLMGYPAVWGSCGATAMQLFRRLRPNSSQPISTPSTDI